LCTVVYAIISTNVAACCAQATSDLLCYVSESDRPLVNSLRRDFGERSLPAIVSTIISLYDLDDNLVSDLALLDAASVGSLSQLLLSIGVDNFPSLFLRIAETVHDSWTEQAAAKRRRYDDTADNDVNNAHSTLSPATYSQQNQSWASAVDYHRQQHH